MKIKLSLRAKLIATIAIVVLITVAIISLLSNHFISKNFVSYISSQQELRRGEIASLITQEYSGGTASTGMGGMHGGGMHSGGMGGGMGGGSSNWNTANISAVANAVLTDGYMVSVLGGDGNSIWDVQQQNSGGCHRMMTDISTRMSASKYFSDGDFITTTYPVYNSGDKVGTVEISNYGPYFLTETDFDFLNSLNILMLLIAVAALIASVIIGGYMAKKVSDPILKTAEVSSRMAQGDYKVRINEKSTTKEVDQLVVSFNELADRLSWQEELRRKLTSDIAHELRTPLTTVSTHLEAMIEGIWEPTPQRLESLYEELGRVTSIVSDLQQLHQIEKEHLPPQYSTFPLWDLVDSTLASHDYEISAKALTLSAHRDNTIVTADQKQLHQVVNNLISNAVKYSLDCGELIISTSVDDRFVYLKIADTGIGIPPEELPFIFERFYRADKSRNRSTGGSGIGLAVVKSIVEAHGGSITAESKLEKGSIFTVKLPVEKAV